jgi:Skp family chaperone for outer membrane proteins
MCRCFLAILVLTAVAGCGKSEAPAAKPSAPVYHVAMVNLDQVARDLGWIDQMQANLNTLQNHFQYQISQAGSSYNAGIEKIRAGFKVPAGGKLTLVQQQTLEAFIEAAQKVINQMQTSAQQQFEGYRQKCVDQYRQAIFPIISDVAKAHNMVMIFNSGDALLYHDPMVDLTSDVSSAARDQRPVLTPIPMPSLPEPPDLTLPSGVTTTPTTLPATRPATRP